jgi:hypothetical protein
MNYAQITKKCLFIVIILHMFLLPSKKYRKCRTIWRQICNLLFVTVSPRSGQLCTKRLPCNKTAVGTHFSVWTMSGAHIVVFVMVAVVRHGCVTLDVERSWWLEVFTWFQILSWCKDWWNVNQHYQFADQGSIRDLTGAGPLHNPFRRLELQ